MTKRNLSDNFVVFTFLYIYENSINTQLYHLTLADGNNRGWYNV